MEVTLYNAKLPADLSVLHYWGTASARDAWLSTNAGATGTVTFTCNLLFPDDGGIIQVPTDTMISDACTYAVFNNGTESRCYFVREVTHTARGAATLRLELDIWGTWYSVGHVADITDPHVITGHGYVDAQLKPHFNVPIVEPVATDGYFQSLRHRHFLFPSDKGFPFAIFATGTTYFSVFVAGDFINPDLHEDPEFDALDTGVGTEYCRLLGKLTAIQKLTSTGDGAKLTVECVGVWFIPLELIDRATWEYFRQFTNAYPWSGYVGETEFPLFIHALGGKATNFPKARNVGDSLVGRYSISFRHLKGNREILKIGSKMKELRDIGSPAQFSISLNITGDTIQLWIYDGDSCMEITDEYSFTVYSGTTQAYLAQNKMSIGVGVLGSAVSLIGSAATGNVVGMVGGGLSLANQLGTLAAKMREPCKADGTPSGVTSFTYDLDRGGCIYAVPAQNFDSCINAIARYGYHVDEMPKSNTWITQKPYVEKIDVDGTVTGTEESNFRYVQIDRGTFLSPGYAIIAAERLRQRFFAGVTIRYD